MAKQTFALKGHNDGASQGNPMDAIKATQCAGILPID
jgi:hypothetical protein